MMKNFEINKKEAKVEKIIGETLNLISSFTIFSLILISISFAAIQSHPASQISPGTFGLDVGIGNYTFPQNLYVNGSLRLIPITTPIEENGVIFYNASSNKFMCYENNQWKACVGGGAISGSGTINYIPIWVSSTELGNSIIYQSSQGIGINTISPLGTLSIGGANGQLVLTASSDGGEFNIFTNASGTLAIYGSNANTLNLRLLDGNLLVDSGNVGIGITPTQKLHVNGSLLVENSTGSALFFVNSSSGNVGIGTTSPNQKLHVIGDINASGYVYGLTGLCIGSECKTSWSEIGNITGTGTTNALTYWLNESKLGALSFGNSGQFLKSQGSGSLPSWSTITLGTDTEGNYVSGLIAGTGINVTGTPGEGWSPNVSVIFGSSAGTAAEGNKQITINPGTGLTGGGTITIGSGGAITLNANTSYLQRRVIGTCDSGNAIRIINEDGSVTCESIPQGTVVSITATGGLAATPNPITSSGSIYVADAGINETHLSSSIAGSGLTGGQGSPLAVNVGTGLLISNDQVQIDTSIVPRKNVDESITGNWVFQNDLTVMKNLRIAGNITYYTVQNINVNGSFVPIINNAFNLGNSSNKWANIYGVNIYGDNLYSGGNQVLTTATNFNGDVSGTYNNLQLGTGVVGTTELADNSVTLSKINLTSCGEGQAIKSIGGGNYVCIDVNPTNVINGSGTANTIAKFTGTNSIGNSKITDDGTIVAINTSNLVVNTSSGNIGIGTTSPTYKLDVSGSLRAVSNNGIIILDGNGNVKIGI